jgi:hypothetical protein
MVQVVAEDLMRRTGQGAAEVALVYMVSVPQVVTALTGVVVVVT